ncbi:LytTR family transcriptional regulator DNA-binding domain-containing protein [Hyphococcus flavus]|uniref:LytTR family transcriptional regulator DNA-binding domain-containing protein n=1 Tax=Hyphococcus flavus TaxID=1866326 RepID=A0AAE9ZA75_9PROT|nr:LytTR family transcriptional regulator DNA-binding domain-containing protein [Hyphococcus flavus]WDI30364.1 LytTR family transcriptional regulator DNA-binding domain-containing protein [Hyphococcus flavus]
MTGTNNRGGATVIRINRFTENSEALSLAAVTLAAWGMLVSVFGGFSYVDAMRAGMDGTFWRALTHYGLGFAPWLVLGPAVFVLARKQAVKNPTHMAEALDASLMFAAAFGAIFLYFVFIYAPIMNMTAAEAVSSTRVLSWSSDIFIFMIVYLMARQSIAPSQPIQHHFDARIAVRSQGREDYVLIRNVTAGSAHGNYVALYVNSGEHLYRGSISDLAERLAPYGLVRVHRSHFVRPECVSAATMKGGAIKSVCLEDGKEIPVSAQYEAAVRQSLSEKVVHAG